MNPTKLMAVALCAAACVTTTAFAEDDLLVDSAAPKVIAEPVNPKPGLIFKGYNKNEIYGEKFKDVDSILASATPLNTVVVTSDKFSFEQFLNDLKLKQGVWEGFLKCKRSAKCTILVKQKNLYGSGFQVYVNGKWVTGGYEQRSGEVNMKPGFNHIKVISQTIAPVEIFLSPSGSTNPPKPLSPAMMYHDEKPEDDVI